MSCSKYTALFSFLIEKGFYYQSGFGEVQLLPAKHCA